MTSRRKLALDDRDYAISDRGYDSPCWIAKTRKGNGRYALIRLDGVERYMHRAMYEQEIGPIPAGMQIDHLCRQTRCINPAHLEVVCPSENTRRGRSTKLTLEQARRAKHGRENARSLASEFGVTEFLIYQIRQGKVWSEI